MEHLRIRYQEALSTGELSVDDEQAAVVALLQQVQTQAQKSFKRSKVWPYLQTKCVPGLYLWGGVGCGKSHLLRLFYETLAIPALYQHFFQFIADVHQALTHHQGEKNPLTIIAKKMAKQYKVICFDEFFVKNIADAMILGELFKALFAEKVTLVATSNIAPDNLYLHGIQREQFLPAIAAIKNNMTVYAFKKGCDYRYQNTQKKTVYYTPANDFSEQQMRRLFVELSHPHLIQMTESLRLFNREIPYKQRSDACIWFEFNDLCTPPRSAHDYTELVKHYHTFFLSHVPVFKEKESAKITLFIHLIDVLYDAHARLILSAENLPEALYPKGLLQFDFQRTLSRLHEMQSSSYLEY